MRYFKLFTWAFLAGSFAFSGSALKAQSGYWDARNIRHENQDLRQDRRDSRHDYKRADGLRGDMGSERSRFSRDLRDIQHDRRDIYRDRRNLRHDSRSYWKTR